MNPPPDYPDFHSTIATMAPVLLLASVALRRYGRGQERQVDSRAMHWVIWAAYTVSGGLGVSAFGVALLVLGGFLRESDRERGVLAILVLVQLTIAALAAQLEAGGGRTAAEQPATARRPVRLGARAPRPTRRMRPARTRNATLWTHRGRMILTREVTVGEPAGQNHKGR